MNDKELTNLSTKILEYCNKFDIPLELLFEFYSVSSDADLISACEKDWRYCIPKDIAVNEFIPQTQNKIAA